VPDDDEIGGKLLGARRGDTAEQKTGNNTQAQPFQVERQNISRSFGHHQYPQLTVHRIERRTKSSADQAIRPDRRHLNEVRSRSRRDLRDHSV
jgi:hypothetical protein